MNKSIYKSWFLFIIPALTLFFNDNLTAQWQKVNGINSRVWTFATYEGKLYAGSETNGIWLSSNSGNNWSKIQTGLFETNYEIKSFVFSHDTIWAGINGGGVIVSYNNGTSWQAFNDGFETQAFVEEIQLVGDTLYAAVNYFTGLQASGVYKTSIDSAAWKLSGTGFPQNMYEVTSFIVSVSGAMIVSSAASGSKGNIQVSVDKGKTWMKRSILNIADVLVLKNSGYKVYAGTSDGIYFTTNDGANWTKLNEELNLSFIDDLVIHNGIIFAAVEAVGVITVSDDGQNVNIVTGNLPIKEDFVSAIFIDGDNLFASLNAQNGVWKAPLTIVSVGDDETIVNGFELSQNYPNPFNPTTTIKYTMHTPAYGIPSREGKERSDRGVLVTLGIYDILGNKITTLVNETKQPGTYEIEFNGSKLPSGIYFYKLTAGHFLKTMKMILLK